MINKYCIFAASKSDYVYQSCVKLDFCIKFTIRFCDKLSKYLIFRYSFEFIAIYSSINGTVLIRNKNSRNKSIIIQIDEIK